MPPIQHSAALLTLITIRQKAISPLPALAILRPISMPYKARRRRSALYDGAAAAPQAFVDAP